MKRKIEKIDSRLILSLRRIYLPAARFSLFVIFFWFGILKLLDLSPATPLATELINKTVGAGLFNELYFLLAILECVIGILFLFPRTARIVIPLLLAHMVIVCSPLLLVPEMTWQSFMVPTLEGQYIIKNIVVVAIALGIAAHTQPLKSRS